MTKMQMMEIITKNGWMTADEIKGMKADELRNIIEANLENKKEETIMNENTIINNQQEEQQAVEVKVAVFENIKSYLNANPDLLNKIKGMTQEEFNAWIPENIDMMLTGSTEHVKRMSIDENLKKISKGLCADLAKRAELVDLTRRNAIRKGAEFFVAFLKWAIGVLIEVLRVVFKIVFCVIACIVKSLICIPASIAGFFADAKKAGEELGEEIWDNMQEETEVENQ